MKKVIAILLCLFLLPLQVFAVDSDFEGALAKPVAQKGMFSYTLSFASNDEASAQVLRVMPFWMLDGEVVVSVSYEKESADKIRLKREVKMSENGVTTMLETVWMDWDAAANKLLYIMQFENEESYEYYNLTGKAGEQEILDNFYLPFAYDPTCINDMTVSLAKEVGALTLQNGTYGAMLKNQEGHKLLEALNTEVYYLLNGGPQSEEKEVVKSVVAELYTQLKDIRLLDETSGLQVGYTLNDNKELKTASFIANLDVDAQKIGQLVETEWPGVTSAKGMFSVEMSFDSLTEEIPFPTLTEENSYNVFEAELLEEGTNQTVNSAIQPGWNIVIEGMPLGMKNGPYIENDRAMAAGQALCHALGIACTYENGVLNIGEGALVFTADSNVCLVDGKETVLETTPKEVDYELFVPVRFLAENYGYKVEFKQEMAADGTVYASIVLIDPVKLALRLVLPDTLHIQSQLLQVAAVISNVDAEILNSPGDGHEEWVRLALSSGDPVIMYAGGEASLGDVASIGELCHDLTPYIEKYAVPTLAMIRENETVKKAVMDENGAIIAFPVMGQDGLELFYIPKTVVEVDGAVHFIHAYSEVVKAMVIK